MCKFCWILSTLLLMAIGTMAYLFVVKGSVAASDDGRTAVILSAGERDLVLTEMRGFLESVQAITMGVVNKDMKGIYENAHKVGMVNAGDVPASLMGKLPLEFKKLGMATHKAFDELALEAQDIGDPQIVLSKLGKLMNNCTTCHAAYKLDTERTKER